METYRQPRELLVVSVHSAEHLLTVSLQVLQLLLDDGRVQRFTLVDQSLALPEDQLDLASVQRDLLLEGLRREELYTITKNLTLVDEILHANAKPMQ